jgi:hypothetical protein
MTIATLMPGRLRTLADVHQEVKHVMCQYKALRTWLRDEEAKLEGAVEFRSLRRVSGSATVVVASGGE